MILRTKALVCAVVVGAGVSLYSTIGYPPHQWDHFFFYLVAILLCSGMKVALPKSDSTMSVNYPFILLGIIQLSPVQAVCLAGASVLAQCRFHVVQRFTLLQIIFNVANVITATVFAWNTYQISLVQLHDEMVPALAVAATVYFLTNTIPLALVLGWEGSISPFKLWRREFLWYQPFYLVGAVLAAAADFVGTTFGWLTSLMLFPVVYTIYRGYREQVAIVRDREQHIIDMKALHMRTIEGLSMAIEAKDRSMHGHLMRVRVYVSELGKLLGLGESQMDALLTAALLHDIGKLAVPEHIINKPGKLTQEEFEKMKIHPVVGADILARVDFPYPVVPIVRAHHEAWDGSGYPDGLKGEQIPIGARILTVVDCFDALASDRPYRKALPLEQVMHFLETKAGTQFDPQIVRLLGSHYQQLERLACQNIEEMHPLKTDVRVERGVAPGAGFEPNQDLQGNNRGEVSREAIQSASATKPHYESLSLIAAASQEAKAVFELTQMLGSSLSLRETSSMMSGRLQPLIPFDCFAVFLKAGTSVHIQYIDGAGARAFSSKSIPLGEGLSGWVAQNERPIINGNPTVEPNYISNSGTFTKESSALSIPLFDLSGSVFGVLTVYAQKPATFSKDHLRILQAIQSKFSLSLQNALRFRTAESDARTDHLTRLYNVGHFIEQTDLQIEKSQGTGERFGLVVCDLNSFKAVNDRYGHLKGNEALRVIAEEFRACCGPDDALARIGGDEFAFLFLSLDAAAAGSRVPTIQQAVQRACMRLQIEVTISCSAGVAFYPEDGASAEELLGKADRRMYRNKRSFYDLDLSSEVQASLQKSISA